MSNTLLSQIELDSSSIQDLQWNYYGKKLAIATDTKIEIYNFNSIENTLTKETDIKDLHKAPITQLSWAHPQFGNIIASCGLDKVVYIFKLNGSKFEKILEYSEHKNTVNSIAFSPYNYGCNLLCGSSDGNISIHSYTNNQSLWESNNIKAHKYGVLTVSWFNSSNSNSNSNNKAQFITGGNDNTIKIWTLGNNKDSEILEGHDSCIKDIVVLESDDVLQFASLDSEDKVNIWRYEEEAWNSYPVNLSIENNIITNISKIAWSSCKNYLSVCSNKATFLCFESEDGWVCDSSNFI